MLTGCSGKYTATLVMCQADEFDTYVYDQNGYYYIYDKETDSITNVPNAGLPSEPMISLLPRHEQWNFIKTTEGRYSGRLEDVESYITAITLTGDYTLVYAKVTNSYLDCYLESEDINVRLIYTSDNIVRIYAKKSDGTYYDPPYINGKVD